MYRERHAIYPLNDVWMVWWPGSQPSYSTYPISFDMVDYKQGGGVRDWRRKIKSGQSATSPFSGRLYSAPVVTAFEVEETVTRKSDGELIKTESYAGTRSSFGGWQPNMSSVAVDAADNQALKYMLRAIQKERTQMQGGVFLGEIRKTVQMVKSPAVVLRKGLGDYISTARSRAVRAPKKSRRKIIADTWLEYVFGWLPLISDISDAAKAYNAIMNKKHTPKLTRTGKAESSSIVSVGGSRGFALVKQETRYSQSSSVRYLVGLRIDVSGGATVKPVLEQFGFVAEQFIPTLWELLPWSFVVDYFTNIGDIINAAATNTSDVTWTCKTVRTINKVQNFVEADVAAMQAAWHHSILSTVRCSPGFWMTDTVLIERSAPVLGLPSFSVSFPGLPTQWVNLGALAVSMRSASRAVQS